MPLSSKLDRKLRPEESTDDEEYYEVTDRSSSPSVIDTGADGVQVFGSDEDGEDEEAGSGEEDSEEDVQAQMSHVSFGALAKAQDALSKQPSANRKRKRGEESSKSQDDKLQALRQRLQEIKAAKMAQGAPASKKSKSSKTQVARAKNDEDSDDDGASEPDAAPRARSSKHAPAVQTSRRPVTRKRKVVEVKKNTARDPRFDNMSGLKPDENAIRKRYAFIDDYKKSEMTELRDAIKKTKNGSDKEKLKKKLLSMESQQKTQEDKDKRQEVLNEHRKKEKELVKQGKQPFYLKKSDQKQLALIDRFQNMKSKDRDRAIERRRKKATAKERKNMPDERRAV
ncbi:DUF947-domain-containing protein [Massarina eburnea CBS 473.64]|uniref:rRNA biogenesis protein RRP36 n=1 Tax=Massarina eburnea CBS 473.64 TaxID=1395130 RepID=A0A6A6RY93_9PLEO|nr:DUF947-domain-containing protein [Massarina eburnea CBS 473.64]